MIEGSNSKLYFITDWMAMDSVESEQNRRRRRVGQAQKQVFEIGKWSNEQNLIYLEFLLDYKAIFLQQGMRKRSQIFMKMANKLMKRSPSQCRSHHQKIQTNSKSPSFWDITRYLLDKTQAPSTPRWHHLKQRVEQEVPLPCKEEEAAIYGLGTNAQGPLYVDTNPQYTLEIRQDRSIIIKFSLADLDIWQFVGTCAQVQH